MKNGLKIIILAGILLISTTLFAQVRIDSDFPFQSDPAKKYSLYIPSGYEPGTPHKAMIGLHPYYPGFDSVAWCDTLTAFAESNNLLLICPDGGPDGRISDPLDQAFTEALLDSVSGWYDLNPDKVFVMGFSVGGLATYTFGLAHPERYAGYIPVGAAISHVSQLSAVIGNSEGEAIYIVHGAYDSPNTRFFPVKNALRDAGAVLNYQLLPGVGHTFDFPNRNAILSTAYAWVDAASSGIVTGVDEHQGRLAKARLFQNHPNPFNPVTTIAFDLKTPTPVELKVFDTKGRLVRALHNGEYFGTGHHSIRWDGTDDNARRVSSGTYFYRLVTEDVSIAKTMILLQ
ncbi:MAG: FlgD immunoglobulin-like domain containing protein [Candidatus Krumholzibacteriota bacterium]